MKTKKQITKLVAGAAIVLAASAPAYGQNNLGAACGCPPVNARTTVTVSALPGFSVVGGTFGGELTLGASFTCDKTYILDQKIYIPSGQILSIQPGTVIKGKFFSAVASASASALVIERGGKILAQGNADCPIVFTAEADPVDGTYPLANKGMWGGVVILGKAHNNLSLAANGPYQAGVGNGKIANADGLGTVEGFATTNIQDRFGVNTSMTQTVSGEPNGQSFNNDDNSGVLKYASIRHSGAFLAVGNEINGLTLASVGRNTIIDHIEIVSCADDNIEIFGGTVNIKHISTILGNDDMFDYDLGWTGKAQFLFGMKADLSSGVSPDNDNGIEADSDDNKSMNLPRSTPIIYNMTVLGNSKTTGLADESAYAGINAKELTGGEIYNSIFANFKAGLNMQQAIGSRTVNNSNNLEAYANWSNTGLGGQILKVKCNTFVGNTSPLTVNASKTSTGTALSGADLTQFTTTDLNTIVSGNTLSGFNYLSTMNGTTNVFSVKNDVIPNPALSVSGCPVAPVDGFFEPAPYRGAFASTGTNWLSDWTYSAVIGTTKGVAPCATDINKDGVTDVGDFLIFAPSFNTTCN